MFANIAILRNVQNLDQLFTYEIPRKFGWIARPGRRVLVPFGTSGQVEGVIIECKTDLEAPSEFAIKKVRHVFDDQVYLSDRDLEVVDYMRAQYMCTYTEAIQLFLPSGTMTTQLKKYSITEKGMLHQAELNEREREIVSQIMSFDMLELSQIETSFSEKIKTQILSKLTAKKWLDLHYDYKDVVKDRYVEVVHVVGDLEAYLMSIPKRYTARIKLCEVLIENPIIEKIKLVKDYSISRTVIDKFIEEDLIEIEFKEDRRMPLFMASLESKKNIELNSEQREVYDEIIARFESGDQNDFLIHGITGSGKTEVYAELIEYMISKGKKTVLLVPEISLTPQIVSRFVSRFGDKRIALLHSKISNGEKHDQWKGIRQGDYDVIIGARSAVFTPSDDIGLIIIDEEHENSYRSEKRPRYETYDIAKLRMKLLGGILVAGSATPSLTSYYDAKRGKRDLLSLKKRFNNQSLPAMEIVDMRRELEEGNMSILSRRLFAAIESRLEKGEQSIIFLNRKGHSTFVSCRRCGYAMACPNCDVTLTYFKTEKTVKCNYCGYESYVPKKCPECESQYFKFFGVGTEKVEESLRKYFKNATIARMDRTTTSKKGSLEAMIADIETDKTDILIGTQMVTKGFDFKNVTLVGILSADLMFNFPSYQASERTYQLVNQVAGRGGRGEKASEVILQTYTPDHYAINIADYETFFKVEMNYREMRKYPPYFKLINLLVISKSENTAMSYAQKAHTFLYKNFLKKDLQNKLELYPTSPALLKKIDGQYRWQILIKCPPELLNMIMRYFKILEDEFIKIDACSLQIDLDARNIL
ncbi:primosomal protein N' [Fusibacter ferrireducens]|uniref:Replication restart protein PriA n=1 Tax=Fusibacter ferrireducens TaxID=2785058 RepID=A0ABR9ZPV8_9FIRM|nr:primosomal protein N' [Fusibacter ferrireducens]MBF4691669.1 primosomal protein N' [Fusibacter ferrireducens]